jgi:DNA polymerase elongation subunit (family B)
MYTYCKQFGSVIYFRDNNYTIKRITKYSWELYLPDKDGKYKSIHGESLKQNIYPSIKSAKDVINDLDQYNITLYGSKSFDYQYIRNEFLKKSVDPISPNNLYIANIDIETGRDEKGYSSPGEARCPVTAITLQDITNDIYYVFGWKPDNYKSKQKNVYYLHSSTEKKMLMKFVKFFSHRYPDIVTGWNCDVYDIPYIINRISRIMGETGDQIVQQLSPFGRIYNNTNRDTFGNEIDTYNIIGISILDYLDLFKKFTYITPENYKLNTVAQLILGEEKVDYSEYGNLQNLFDTNYELFIDYNIKDVNLVARIDQKLKLFDLILSVAYKAGINYNDVFSPVKTWDVLIYNAIMDQGMVPPIKMPESIDSAYIGAYVKEPIPKRYKWIVSCDLNSLYPHLQMGINISPEKKLNDTEIPSELWEIRKQLNDPITGIEKLLNEEIDTEVLKQYNVTLSPNGQFYRRDSDGFIPVILEGLYSERKAVKGSMLDDKKKMEADSSIDLTNQIAAKNTLQMALKILMNSEYGALANKYFRYFDIDNAEAVTSSGQLAILWVAKHLNIFLNKLLRTTDEDYVIAIDTDSVYLNLERLVKKFIGNAPKEKIVDLLDNWAKDILEPEIDRIYTMLAKYINAHKQKMVMKREVIADNGFWTGKKRYALNVYDSEGVRFAEPKVKIMGLECVRSSVPEFARNKIKNVITMILRNTEEETQKFIQDTEEEFYKQTPETISFPRGTNNIEKWMQGDLIKKGCPIHVRGSIVYNQYLSSLNSVDERIQSGDKIKFCYLRQPNLFRSAVISYPPIINEEIYEEIKEMIDYEKQWEGTFHKPIQAMMNIVGWNAQKIIKIEDFCQGEEY